MDFFPYPGRDHSVLIRLTGLLQLESSRTGSRKLDRDTVWFGGSV